ncbi:LytTR family DNA-binding domain-containing protein [Maricaulis sp.]|uniref:LytR/AlgR family response regulator transcription factor n=1 Tax=Maricaulis sp. TaxID=1486257 RepID=UPI00262C0E25|nr:LytTR family DNA-binding domain-containing protein [Maricaulis sp.]
MKRSIPILALLLLLLAPQAPAQVPILVDTATVRACPAGGAMLPPADFTGPDCIVTDLWSLDPQGRELWVEARLVPGAGHLAGEAPLGLAVSGKMSSEVWLNGTRLGANGRPGPDRASEIPGQMDAIFYVPRSLVREGENTVVMHVSAMHGFLRLAAPVHGVMLTAYGDPVQRIALAYWPALITFGCFVLGFLFFGVMAVRDEDREGSALLALASFFAGGQLLSEASRGLFAYPYPFHDFRLVLIVGFAFAFGLCLNAYLLQKLSGLRLRARGLRLAGIALVMLGVVALTPGFDGKTGYTLLTATGIGAAWCALWTWQRKPGAWIYLALMTGFAALVPVFQGEFLDLYFFIASAALLLFLFYRQALTLVRDRQRRRAEELRAQRLETALAEARQRLAPAQLQLVSAGRVDYVATDRIVQLKGAGDYVEVHFQDGRTALYNGSLTGLEDELPGTFLRVHRSHIVNTAFVSALERDGSGIGRLLLSNGTDAPVSRRIMPKVRSALAAE